MLISSKYAFYIIWFLILSSVQLFADSPICKINETGEEYSTIQDALDVVSSGQHIDIYPGTYTGADNVNLNWPNVHNVTLRAIPTTGTSLNVILDAQNSARHISQENAVSWNLDNIQLINGYNYSDLGGSIKVSTNSAQRLTIEQCIFANNYAKFGGAIYNTGNAKLVVNNSLFENNSAKYGGAISFGINTISNCVLSANLAYMNIARDGYGNLLDNNGGDGGVFFHGDNTIHNSLIIYNKAEVYGGGQGGRGGVFFEGKNTLTDCSIKSNSSNDYGYAGVFYKGENSLTDCQLYQNGGFGGGAFYDGKNMLTNCDLEDNNAYGGSVFLHGDNHLTNCRIANGNAYSGGVFGGGINTLYNCYISNNRAAHGGVSDYGINTLVNCVLYNNSHAVEDSAIFDRGETTIINSTIVNNSTYTFTNDGATSNTFELYNSILTDSFENTKYTSYKGCTINMSALTDRYLPVDLYLANSISQIVTADIFIDHDNADFHLVSGSVVTDAGDTYWLTLYGSDLLEDISGNNRIIGSAIDMGAYESSYIRDNTPPVISHTQVKIDTLSNIAITITTNVEEDRDISSLMLFYKVSGTSLWLTKNMLQIDGSTKNYYTVIPENEVVVPGVDYYFVAFDSSIPPNQTILPPIAPESYYSTAVYSLNTTQLELTWVYNYPNPFKDGGTTFGYFLSLDADTTIKIFTTHGVLVKELNCAMGLEGGSAGYNRVGWDGQNEVGKELPNDVYLYVIEAGNNESSVRIVSKLAILR